MQKKSHNRGRQLNNIKVMHTKTESNNNALTQKIGISVKVFFSVGDNPEVGKMQEGNLDRAVDRTEGIQLEEVQVDQSETSAEPVVRPLVEIQTLHLFCPSQAYVVSAKQKIGVLVIYSIREDTFRRGQISLFFSLSVTCIQAQTLQENQDRTLKY